MPLIVSSGSKLFGIPPPSPGPTDLLAPSVVLGVQVAISGTTNTITFEPAADAFANATGVNDYIVKKDGTQIANPAGDGAINPNFTYTDIGATGIAGSATVNATGVGWTLKGAGADFFGTADIGGFFNAPATSDLALRSQIISFAAAGSFAKTGVMFRASTAANASFVHLCLNYGVNTVSMDVRNGTGASATNVASFSFGATPVALKLVPVGNVYSAYYSANGNGWTLLGSATVALGGSRVGGHTICSHVNGTLATALISNFTLRSDGLLTVNDTGNVVGAVHSYTVTARDTVPNAAAPSAAVSTSSSAGIKVGASGKLVSTEDGSIVTLRGFGISGFMFGNAIQTNVWTGCAAPTSQDYHDMVVHQVSLCPTGGQAQAKFNSLRLYMSVPCWLALTGIDPYNNSGAAASYYRIVATDANGRTEYCAGTSGGGVGSGVGNETRGDFSTYRALTQQILTNWFGARALLEATYGGSYPLFSIVDLQWGAPLYNGTNQALMTNNQTALLSTLDVECLQSWAATPWIGSDQRVMVELFNETYGSNTNANFSSTENAWIGNGNGSNSSFAFPTTTTCPNTPTAGWNYCLGFTNPIMGGGGTSGSPKSCQSQSFQAASDAFRTANGKNVLLVGCTIASQWPAAWSVNGGSQVYNDTYTVGGIKQSAATYHSYSNGATTTQFANLVAAGMPVVQTEFGSITPGNLTGNPPFTGSSFNYWSNTLSGWHTCAFANFRNLLNIAPNDGAPFSNNWTFQGMSAFKNHNTPVNNAGSDNSQIPTGSN
jgi:hypothetical protein